MDVNGASFLSFVDKVVKEEEGHLRQMEAGSSTRRARSFVLFVRLFVRSYICDCSIIAYPVHDGG